MDFNTEFMKQRHTCIDKYVKSFEFEEKSLEKLQKERKNVQNWWQARKKISPATHPNLSTPSSFVIWRAPDFRFERLQALAQNGVGGFDVAR